MRQRRQQRAAWSALVRGVQGQALPVPPNAAADHECEHKSVLPVPFVGGGALPRGREPAALLQARGGFGVVAMAGRTLRVGRLGAALALVQLGLPTTSSAPGRVAPRGGGPAPPTPPTPPLEPVGHLEHQDVVGRRRKVLPRSRWSWNCPG